MTPKQQLKTLAKEIEERMLASKDRDEMKFLQSVIFRIRYASNQLPF